MAVVIAVVSSAFAVAGFALWRNQRREAKAWQKAWDDEVAEHRWTAAREAEKQAQYIALRDKLHALMEEYP